MYNIYLSEVSEYAPKILREIEGNIEILRNNYTDKNARTKLVLLLRKFTKIDKVNIFYQLDEFNAGVIPTYKKSISSDFSSKVRDVLGGKDVSTNRVKSEDLKKLKFIAEPTKYIESLNIFIGVPLLKALTPPEMVATLLHEIGHTFNSTSNISYIYMGVVKELLSLSFAGYASLRIVNVIEQFLPVFYFGTLALVYGITITQHRNEYNADKYVVKYGYGDELVRVFKKLDTSVKIRENRTSIKTKLSKFLLLIKDFLVTAIFSYEHPSVQSRVDQIEDLLYDKYKELYPKYATEIKEIQKISKK